MTEVKRYGRFAAVALSVAVVFPQARAGDYWLAGSDPGSASSMNGSGSSAGWATSATGARSVAAATSGNIYHVGVRNETALLLRTPANSTGYAFLGDQLVLEGGVIAHKGKQNSFVTIPNLLAASGSSQINMSSSFTTANAGGYNGSIWTIGENAELLTLVLGGSGSTKVRCDLVVDTKVVGSGKLAFRSESTTDLLSASVTYKGDLSEFTGKFEATGLYSSVKFSAGGMLSSGPKTLDPESIVVRDTIVLSFAESTELHANRGVWLDPDGKVTIDVAAGKTVRIRGPLTAPGGFIKTGEGTLLLGGVNYGYDIGLVDVKAGSVLYGAGPVVAVVKGYRGPADGQKHSPSVDIQDPRGGVGCTVEWKVADGEWSAKIPSFTEPVQCEVSYRIACEHYDALEGTVEMVLLEDVCAYVSNSGSNESPYDTPEKAARNLQDAVNAACAQEAPKGTRRCVHVAAGAYSLGAPVTATGVNIIGTADRSVIFSDAGIALTKGEISGATFRAGATVGLNNATMTNCLATGVVNAVQTTGESRIVGCELRDAANGSYVILAANKTTVMSTTITNNTLKSLPNGLGSGAAIFVLGDGVGEDLAQLVVSNCQVSGNTAELNEQLSSAIVSTWNQTLDGQSAVFDHCEFRNNIGRFGFGRISYGECVKSSIKMRNCLCVGHKSIASGGALVFVASGEIVNCTFDHCKAGGSLQTHPTTKTGLFSIYNCIFRHLELVDGSGTLPIGGVNPPLVYNSVVYPSAASDTIQRDTNYFDRDVKFVGPGKSRPEFALERDSFGVGLGDKSVWESFKNATDLAGGKRITCGKVDVGCYQILPPGFMLLLR